MRPIQLTPTAHLRDRLRTAMAEINRLRWKLDEAQRRIEKLESKETQIK